MGRRQGGHCQAVGRSSASVGLDFGVYLSPWDQHEPTYALELQYNQFYLGQLQELLTK